MGTTANIAIEKKDKIEFITVNFDGYLIGVGLTLMLYYRDKNKIQNLINLGDVSALKKEIFPTGSHSFSNPQQDITVFYGRDRGEKNWHKNTIYDKSKLNQILNDEYNYIFNEKNEKWYVYDNVLNKKTLLLKELKENLKKDKDHDYWPYESKKEFLNYLDEIKIKKDYMELNKELKENFNSENNNRKILKL